MKHTKDISEAISDIKNFSNIFVSGFVTTLVPQTVLNAIRKSFDYVGYPNNLNLVSTTGLGDKQGNGIDVLAKQKLLRSTIYSHYGLLPNTQRLIKDNLVQSYALPQGTLTSLLRDAGGYKQGVITSIGKGTFIEHGEYQLNSVSTKTLVEDFITNNGNGGVQRQLYYKPLSVDVAVVKVPMVDIQGNISLYGNISTDVKTGIMAAKANGGLVIVESDQVVLELEGLPDISGKFVDYVVQSEFPETVYEPRDKQVDGLVNNTLEVLGFRKETPKQKIAKKAAEYVKPNAIINLGIGTPEMIAEYAPDSITLTVESGCIGGTPRGGLGFGTAEDVECIISHAESFDFIHAGGLDQTFIGMAEFDVNGNVNIHNFGGNMVGCGGAIDITQSTKEIYFCGTLFAKGKLKLVESVEQVTFSGKRAAQLGQTVKYITDKAVFELKDSKLVLTEDFGMSDNERQQVETLIN